MPKDHGLGDAAKDPTAGWQHPLRRVVLQFRHAANKRPASVVCRRGRCGRYDGDSPRESDQLPSAISMVQHTSDPHSPIRLCSVNVERGAAATERVHQQLHGGHGDEAISMLIPHPACSIVASCDQGGETILWESAAFSAVDARRRRLSHAGSAAATNVLQQSREAKGDRG